MATQLSTRVSIDVTQLQKMIQNINKSEERFFDLTARTLTRWMQQAERWTKKSLTGPKLSVRTGRLRASISNRVEVGFSGDGKVILTGILGVLTPTDARVLEYAGAQEYGATVWPRNRSGNNEGKLLTIPLRAAKAQDRDKGATRFTAAEAKQKYKYTFWKLTKNANLILFGIKGGTSKKDRKLIPLFLGLRRVKIAGGTGEGKQYLREGLSRIIDPFQEDLSTKVQAMLNRSGKSGE